MNTYENTKRELDRIRSEYSCKGDLLFRQAIHTVIENGTSNLIDDYTYKHLRYDTNEYHNNAEAEGKNLYVSRDFELAILECAREIAQVNIGDLLIYIQKDIWVGREGGIDYQRAIQLLKGCIGNIEQWNDWRSESTLRELEGIGFDDNEIEELGFAYVLDAREEE